MLPTALPRLAIAIAVALSTAPAAEASVISCPTDAIQDQLDPTLRQLCLAIEQAVEDLPRQPMNARIEDPNNMMTIKRNDDSSKITRDHEFLRFGRRFGL
ncbi:unnamed protein product [Phaedon cochleariae]|uniref:Myosuppressin n=1 Tax=Phaedon cochleariae TaxID=80249 RepID=A0A9P0DFJ3_PHACE|nr:unnamed protein product [Phaedon cochleariae]